MIVECAKCGTRFRLDEQKIGGRGARVRCAKCQHSFVVQRPPLAAGLELEGEQRGQPRPPARQSPEPPRLPRAPASPSPSSPPPRQASPRASGPPPLSPLQEDIQPFGDDEAVHQAETLVYTMPAQMRPPTHEPHERARAASPTGARPFEANGAPVAGMAAGAPPSSADDAEADSLVDASDSVLEIGSDPGRDAPASPAMSGGLGLDGTFYPPDSAAPQVAAGDASEDGERTVVARLDKERLAAWSAQMAAAPADNSAADREPRPRTSSLVARIAVTVLAVAVLTLGVLIFLGGGRLDPSLVGLGEQPRAASTDQTRDYEGVAPVSMRSVLYPTHAGSEVLVFVGTAENRSAAPKGPIDVVAELRDESGNLVASERAPLGLALDPPQLAGLTGEASLRKAFEARALRDGQPPLAAGARVPFTVVMLNAPEGLERLRHRVRLAAGEPVLRVGPEPRPPLVELPRDSQAKAKHKARFKAKRRRGKHKGKLR